MVKVMAFLWKRPEVTRADLIEHYERRHVPLILGLAKPPMLYRRNYVEHDDSTPQGWLPDVITELEFEDRAEYASWVATLYAPGSGVADDEDSFLDRSRTTSITVDERSTG